MNQAPRKEGDGGTEMEGWNYLDVERMNFQKSPSLKETAIKKDAGSPSGSACQATQKNRRL